MAVLLVTIVVARVAILRTAIDATLAARGFSDVRYHIATVGLTQTRIVDLQLGPELAAAELALHYRLLQLTRLEIDQIAVAGLHVDLTTGEGATPGPVARLLSGNEEQGSEPTTALPRLPPLRIADGLMQLPGNVAVSLNDLQLSPSDDGADYKLAIKGLELARESQKASLNGLAASIAADGAGASGPTVHFTIAALKHDVPEPFLVPLAFEGTVERIGEAWRLTSTASAVGTLKLMVAGSYNGSTRTAEGRVTVPATTFAPGALQPGEIAPPLTALANVVGSVEGHLGLHWRDGTLAPEGALRLDRLGFELGGVPIEDLSARLVVAGDASQPVIRLHEARLTLAGGLLAIDDATLRPLADTNRLVLQARGIDLGRLLAALDVEGVSGEGRITGRIPLVLSGDSIAVEAGKLEADGAGVLRIASEQTAAALAQGGADTNLLLQALADFHYERLALSIDKPLAGESRLTLNTLGHNPAVLDGHPFQINVTVTTNLDKILDVIASGSRLSQEVIRAIVGANR